MLKADNFARFCEIGPRSIFFELWKTLKATEVPEIGEAILGLSNKSTYKAISRSITEGNLIVIIFGPLRFIEYYHALMHSIKHSNILSISKLQLLMKQGCLVESNDKDCGAEHETNRDRYFTHGRLYCERLLVGHMIDEKHIECHRQQQAVHTPHRATVKYLHPCSVFYWNKVESRAGGFAVRVKKRWKLYKLLRVNEVSGDKPPLKGK